MIQVGKSAKCVILQLLTFVLNKCKRVQAQPAALACSLACQMQAHIHHAFKTPVYCVLVTCMQPFSPMQHAPRTHLGFVNTPTPSLHTHPPTHPPCPHGSCSSQ